MGGPAQNREGAAGLVSESGARPVLGPGRRSSPNTVQLLAEPARRRLGAVRGGLLEPWAPRALALPYPFDGPSVPLTDPSWGALACTHRFDKFADGQPSPRS
jgi:hypothetical protein